MILLLLICNYGVNIFRNIKSFSSFPDYSYSFVALNLEEWTHLRIDVIKGMVVATTELQATNNLSSIQPLFNAMEPYVRECFLKQTLRITYCICQTINNAFWAKSNRMLYAHFYVF